MKNVELSDAVQLQQPSTVNHLRMDNMDEFLNSYDPISYYVSPFSVLAQLECKVKFNTQPEEIIFCTYKPDGEVMFRLVSQKIENGIRIITYRYLTHV